MTGPDVHPIPIESIDDPRVSVYGNLKDADLARRDGLFIAEGPLVVRQLLESEHEVHSVLVAESKLGAVVHDVARRSRRPAVFTASQETLDAIAGIHLHRGILACGIRPLDTTLESIVARCTTLLVLEDLSNHDNIGGLFRVAAGLGGARCGVILSPRCCDPYYRKSLRVSIGHVLRTPFVFAEFTPDLWARLASAGFVLVSTAQAHAPRDVADLGRPAKVALVLGAEGPGLRAETDRAIRAVGGLDARIPMAAGVDSLNIVVAAGVLLSHLVDPRE